MKAGLFGPSVNCKTLGTVTKDNVCSTCINNTFKETGFSFAVDGIASQNHLSLSSVLLLTEQNGVKLQAGALGIVLHFTSGWFSFSESQRCMQEFVSSLCNDKGYEWGDIIDHLFTLRFSKLSREMKINHCGVNKEAK